MILDAVGEKSFSSIRHNWLLEIRRMKKNTQVKIVEKPPITENIGGFLIFSTHDEIYRAMSQ